MPHNAAGMRIEPPVSLPIAISHMPSAAATAAPEDEPPGTRARSRGLPGVPKCGLAPIAAQGELGHVGLGDDHRAGGAQPAHHRRVGRGGRRLVGEDFRAGAGRLAGDVEQILDADDGAVERAERHAVFGARIGGVGRRARGLGIDRQAGARPLPFRVGDAREAPVRAGRGRREISLRLSG